MGNEVLLSSIKRLNAEGLTVGELLQATHSLQASGEADMAIQLYKLWIQINKDSPFLYAASFNLSVALSGMNDIQGAKEALERAIAHSPDFHPAYINLGGIFEKTGALGAAIMQWNNLVNKLEAVTGPGVTYKTMALKQIGRVMEANQHFPQAENIFRQSLEINPHQYDVIQHYIAGRLAQCEWPVVQGWEGMDHKTLMRGTGPLSMAVYTDDPILQLAAAWNYGKEFIGYPSSDLRENHITAERKNRQGRRRIGYVSSDLRHHAVGFIMAELFELHDRSEFEVFIYYCGIPNEDPMKARIRNSAEHWVDISAMDDATAAKQIVSDGIDILVDVNGFTKDARTKIFALRPAPVIVNWLGYPGSMGTPYHHYIIADDYIIPKSHEMYYSEKVLRLPCYQPNDRKRAIAEHRPTRQEMKLPEDSMVFCCFNGLQKVSQFTFDRWITILQSVPGSVLWLLEGVEGTSKRLLDYATQRGIAPERIIFANKIHNSYHLSRYLLADLFLDTTPYGAHVTASDALWMGTPILTVSGRSFAARVCGSLLTAAGMAEMICGTPEEYVEKAIQLGKDKAAIEKLKKKLQANRDSCVLFDMPSTVRHLEKLYTTMWKSFQQGQLPRPDMSNLDVYLELGGEFDHEAVEMLTVKDYEGMYKAKLLQKHTYCPIRDDHRLWTADDIAVADAPDSHSQGIRPFSRKASAETGSRKTSELKKEFT